MSTQRLGRVEDLDTYWFEHLQEPSEDIELEEPSQEKVPELEEVEDYPFRGQLKISGQFTYYDRDRSGDSVPYSGEYEYRSGSELFLIHAPSDRIRTREVFAKLNQRLADNIELERALSLDRMALWEFLKKADDFTTLQLRGPEGSYDAHLLLRLLNQENPQEALWEADFENTVDRKALEAMIKRENTEKSPDSLEDLDIDLFRTTIRKAEGVFYTPYGYAEFQFRGGIPSISGENDDAQEYLVQIFERDVIYPSYS